MKNHHPFFSLSHLLLLLILSALGTFCILVSRSFLFMNKVVMSLLEQDRMIFFLGVILLIIAVLLTIGFLSIHASSYLQVDMGKNKISINQEVIQDYLQKKYWKKHFGDEETQTEVFINKKQVIEITAYLPYKEDSLEAILEQSEKDLSKIFSSQFSYNKRFILKLFKI